MARIPSPMEPDANCDDDFELTEYIWRNYPDLIAGREHRIGRYNCITDAEAESIKSPQFRQFLQARYGPFSDADAEQGKKDLAAGLLTYKRKVRNRVLKAHSEDVTINRCPKCQRILTSPNTRQCLPCRLKWHACTPQEAISRQESQ